MTDKRGTGHTFLEIDLGHFGRILVRDDNAQDTDAGVYFQNENGVEEVAGLVGGFSEYRDEYGDAAFEAELKDQLADQNAVLGGSSSSSPSSFTRQGNFVCDGCHKTFPPKDNQTPSGSKDLCPDCC